MPAPSLLTSAIRLEKPLWCKVDRNYGNLFPVNWNSVRYDGVGCQARSTLGKKKPL
ncbi:hypothetical protein [Nonomuraea sp. NPDC049758]|uniref:hypothetical protein n=1 Tax=Nonomuraea sp. NPDC049758 TaxID=3154360 RepID=UPI003425FE6D